jgi:hypothetical protein
LIVLTALTLIHFALYALKTIGFAEERITMFDTIDYYGYLAVLVIIVLDLVHKIGAMAFTKPDAINEPNSE